MKFSTLLFESVRIILILLFTYTAVSKTMDPVIFYEQLTKIPFIQHAAIPVAIAVPAVEFIAAIMLVFKKWEIKGWWLSALLLSIFSIYIAAMMLFAPNLPCSCGGIIAALSWQQHLWLNILLAVVCRIKLYHHYFIVKFSMHTRE